ncbi:MAG: protein kinase [Acidobacteria bacterium]|nr:protein kinase [Acidobacteriota bacterium]
MKPAPSDWPRVREVFEAALPLPPEQRRAYVVAACGADQALAGRVQELLAAHERANGFLESPALISEIMTTSNMEGKRIGPYQLMTRIGAGGMGEVYKARDTRLDRTVAVKVLSAHGAHDSQARERFEREARAVAALNHPHICTLYDIGSADDVDFLVMEYVDGSTLRGPMSGAEALRLALQIASALAAAHRHGILHRDIKPGNVMTTASGVKLLDFGLAKSMHAEADVTFTSEGTVLGTVAYMSPEQAQGCHLDARSDIFSFGAVLYEMVSGNRAFGGTTPPQVLSAILRDDPPPLWPSSPLEPIIGKCLAKHPGERFQDMEEVIHALELVGVAPRQQAPSIAVLPFTSMSADADNEYFSDGIAEEIINALTQLEGLRVVARTSSFSFKGKPVDIGEIARRLNVRHLLQGSVRRAAGRVRVTAQLVDAAHGFQIWSERFDRELADIFDVQDEIARAIVRRLKVEFAIADAARLVKVPTTNMEAYQAYLKGRAMLYRRGPWIAPALESFKKAVELDQDYAQAWAGLADAYTVLCYSGHDRPDRVMPEALGAAMRALEIDPGSPEAHNALACASLLWERDFNRAEREFLHALAVNPKYIQARCWYGLFFLQWTAARHDEGIAQVWQAFEADPLSAYVATVVSFALGTVGRAEEALGYAKTAVEQDPQSFLGRWELAIAYHWNEQYEDALAVLETLWAESPSTWVAMRIVPTYAKVGRVDKARAIYDELLARRDHAYVPPFVLAACEAGLGDHEAAIASCLAAVEARDVLLGLFSWLPDLEPLRADPRFTRLMQRFNARPAAGRSSTG